MKKKRPAKPRRPVVETLEPRILYSADFSPIQLDHRDAASQAEQRTLDPSGEFTSNATQTHDASAAAQSSRHEVVFVDTAVPDYEKLVQDITANSSAQHHYDVVLLKSGTDGIKQITQTLAGMHDISAVHIISHGSDGEVQLGGATLNLDSLLKNASQIKGWGQALAPGADILIYGCDVAEYADGKGLVSALGRLTGADVAASTDLTGAGALGGDWALEYHTGAIQAGIVVSAQEQASYTGILQGVAVGGETLVNTTTAGTQQSGPSLNGNSVAVAADGSYVVVWSGQGPGGSGDTGGNAPGVFFQRFSAAGAKLGGEIQVNQTTANAQQNASIAMDANGNFVIAWAGNGTQAGNVDTQGVFFRRYNAAGVAQGGETLVNTTTAGNQQNASIAMNASGNFIVAWDGNGTQVGNVDTQGVFFQRYNTAGVKQGTETLVNTTTALNQQNASIAMDASGNFIFAWDGNGTQVGNVDTQGVFFQRYNPAGVKQGTETLVNTTTALNQQNASIAMDANGNFIVAWDGNGTQVGNVDTQGVFFQRYNTAGAKQGAETLVNQTTANNQLDPSIAMDTNGNFVVSWTSTSQPGDVAATTAVVKRDFNADGTANGGETLVNTTTAGTQSVSSVAMNAYDQYVVIWQGNGVGDAAGVFSQRYAAALIVDTTNDTYDAPFAQNAITISQLLNNKGPDTFISLREAIDAADNTANMGAPDRIYFRIPGAGTHTINLSSALPNINDAVTIDGYSQPGASANTQAIGDNAVLLIELNGAGAGGGSSGLVLAAGSSGSTIRGLVINRFTASGIRIVGSSNNTVVGNFLGTNVAGTAALGNQVGVYTTGSSTNNTIGGTTPADRNIISGNTVDGVQIFGAGTQGNVVAGNYIGLGASGTLDLGNASQGVAIFSGATNNTVGGTASGAGNVISGNNGEGVRLFDAGTDGNVVLGNLIGTNAAGTSVLGTSDSGVHIGNGAASNTIGGSAAGAGNVIVGSGHSGIHISEDSDDNVIRGNWIGTNSSGAAGMGNGYNGVNVDGGGSAASSPTGTVVGGILTGEGNVIAFNTLDGVVVGGAGTAGTAISGNSIYSNGGLGIDLAGDGVTGNDVGDPDTGPNNLQNYPVFTSAITTGTQVTITGSFSSLPNRTYRFEFFASATADPSGHGQAERYLGFVNGTTDGSGNLAGSMTLTATVAVGEVITGTATDLTTNNTSEFALNVVASNNAPVLSGANNLTAINEDPVSNAGTLVSALIAGKVSDSDSGALSGIAVTAVVNSNGTWQYSTNGGGIWNAFGAPSAASARLLAADANTYVRFVPNADWNGTVAGGITFRAWDQTSGVAGSTANTSLNGGSTAFSSATASASVTVNSVNDAPAGANNTVTTNEDSAYTFAAADFGFGDPNDVPANSLLAVKITSLPGAGLLTDNGVAVTLNQFVGVADITGGLLKFTPAPNANGAGYASFNFAVQDGGGTASGGVDTDPTPNTITINVTAVDDAPVLAMSSVLAYTENQAATAINTVITTTDVDNATLASGTVSITANFAAGQDVLGFTNVPATMGNIAGVYNAGTGVMTLTSAGAIATTAQWQAALRAVTYSNSSDGPSVAARTVSYTVNDGAVNSNTLTGTINVTAVNDAPVLDASKTPVLGTINEDAGAPVGAVGTLVSSLVDFASPAGQVDNVTDADSGPLLGIAVTAADATNGTWWYSTNNGASWNAMGVPSAANSRLLSADANTLIYFQPNPNFNGTVASAITFRGWDQTSGSNGALASTAASGGITAFSAATDTAAITVTAVNDAPTATNMSAAETYTEDTALNLINVVVSDVDSPNVVVTFTLSDVTAGTFNTATAGSVTSTFVGGVWTASGAIANVNTLLAGLTFTPAANYNANFTVATSVSDGVAPALTGTKAFTGTPVNDAPVLDASKTPVLVTINEDAGAPVGVVGTLVSSLVDFASPAGQMDNVTDADSGALLGIAVTAADATNGSWWFSTDGGTTWAALGVPTAANSRLLSADANTRIAFQSNANFNGTVASAITFRAWDQTSGSNGALASTAANGAATAFSATTDAASITVNAVNDPPVLATSSVLAYTENQAATAINGVLTVGDVDNPALASATVSITSNFASGQDVLGFTNVPATMGNIAGVYNAATGVMTLNSAGATATLAQWQAALRAVNYSNSSDGPAVLARTVSYTVNDGTVNSNTVTSTINVTAVNDAPALATSSVLAYTENQAATAINTVLTVNDADNATLSSGTVSITTNFAAGEDVLGFTNVSATMGNITGVYSAATGVMTFTSAGATATLAQWQAALQSVTYSNSSDTPSPLARTVSYRVNDGALNSNIVTSTINVAAVDDAPVLATGSVLAYTENQAATAINTGITATDLDNATLSSGTVSITTNFAAGQDVLGFTNVPATMGNIAGSYNALSGVMTLTSAGSTATLAQWQAALQAVTYSNSSDNPSVAARSVSYTVNDGTVNSNIVTSTINVSAVNDAPALATGSVLAYTENQAASAINTVITTADLDNATLASGTVSITTNFTVGQDVLGFTNVPATMGNIAGSYNALSGVMTLTSAGSTATLAQWQAALQAVTYSNSSDNPSVAARTVSYVVNDGTVNSNTVTSTINVSAVNDAPVNTVPAAQTTSMNSAITLSGVSAIVVNDMDANAGLEQVTLSVSNGTLSLGSVAGLSTVTGDGTGSVVFSGTLANLNNALNGLTYTPNLNYAGADTLTVSSDDLGNTGTGGALVSNSTVNFTVLANQAPTLSATANNPTFQEAAGVGTQAAAVSVFSAATESTIEAGQNIIGLNFTVSGLLDGASERIVVDGSAITLGANSSGTTTTNAMSYTVNIVAGTATVTLSKPAGVSTANIATVINGITYQNTNTDNPSAGNRVFTLTQIQDSGGTVSGGVDTTALAIASTVNVTAVNDAPALATGSVLAYTENQAASAINTGITATDLDNATLSSGTVSITTNFAAGQDVLGFTNVPATMGNIAGSYNALSGVMTLTSAGSTATLAQWQAALQAVTYSNSSDNPSVAARSVSYTVNDGTVNSNIVTSTINVSAVNDAPALATGSVLAYTENQAASAINTVITTADLDNATLASGTVSITTNFTVGQDVLGFTNVPATMGNIAGSYNALSGVMTLTSAGSTATLAQWQAALQAVTYSNSSDNPSVAARTVSYVVNDGTVNSNTVTSTINVTAVNDAPVMSAGATVGYSENAAAVVIDNTITIADVDDTQIAGASVTIAAGLTAGDVLGFVNTGSISGSYNAGTGVLTLSGTDTLANYQAALRSVTYSSTSNDPTATSASRSIAWQVTDANSDGVGAQSSAVVTSTINVSAVNDAPVMSAGATVGYSENAPAVAIDNTITIVDVDDTQIAGATVTISAGLTAGDVLDFVNTGSISGSYNAGTGVLTLSGTDTLANYQTAVRSVTYSSTSDDPTNNATAPNRTISWRVTDANSDGAGAVNSAAVTSTVNVTALADAPVVAAGATTGYIENAPAVVIDNTVTIADVDDTQVSGATVTISAGLSAGDVLGFINTASISGSYNAGTGVLTLSGTDTLANYQAALRSVTYSSTSNGPTATSASRSITWQVTDANSDGLGAQSSAVVTSTINVTAVNDAPVGTNNTVTTNEDTAYTFGVADFGFTDPNDIPANTLSAVMISSLPGAGSLTLSGVAVISGQTISLANISAGNLQFTPSADANGAGYAAFTFQVQDNGGTANGGVDLDVTPRTMTVNVTSVNDAPVGTNNTVTTNEDTAYTFGVVDFGFTDPNDIPANSLSAVMISSLPGAGSLTLSGVAVTSGQTISLASISAGNLQFTPSADANGAGYAAFTFQVQDNGGTANGGVDLDVTSRTMTVNVTAVNDAATATNLSAAESYTEDTPLNLTNIVVSDVDSANVTAILTLSNVAAGSLSTATSGAVTSTYDALTGVWTASGTLTDVNTLLAGVSFTPALNFNSNFTIATSVSDGVAAPITGSKAMTGTPVNDAPTATNLSAAESYTEDTPLNLTNIVVSDVDSANVTAILTLSNVAAGSLTTATSGAVTSTYNALTGVWTASGALADVNTLLAGVSFTPALDFNSNFTIATSVSDGVAAPITGSKVMTGTPVNDAPQGADNSVSTLENTDYIFGVADFGLTDPKDSPSDALLAVRINSLPGAGTLMDNGVAVTAGQFVSAADIAANLLVFTPTPGTNGVGYANFSFQVQDDGGTANGGADLDTTSHTMTLNVFSVNDAPVGTNNAVTTNEDTAYTFGTADFGFTDPNDIPANSLSAVMISSLPGTGSLTLSGVAVTSGQTISLANITAGNLKFTPAADANGAGYAAFTFQVQDNGGTANGGVDLDITPRTMTVNVTAVNDAPVGTNNTVTTNEDSAYTFGTADFGFTDPNDIPASTLAAVRISSLPGAGSLTLSGVAVTSGQTISLANISAGNLQFTPAADANGAGYAAFAFQVQDNGGTANGGVNLDVTPRTMTVNVTAVNDAPQLGNNTLTINQGGTVLLSSANLSATDVDSSVPALTFVVSSVQAGRFELVSAPGVAVTTFTVADVTGSQVRFVQDGSSNAPSYLVQVNDAAPLFNGPPTAASIVFNVTPPVVVTPPPVVVPPPPSPPSGGNNPGQPGKSGGDSDNQRAIAPEVVHSPGRIVAKLNEMADDHPAEGEARRGQAAQPKATLNDFRQRNADGPAASAPTMTMASLAFTSSKPADWTTQSAFPNAGEEVPHDQIQILMDSVKMGGLALSVGVVWWASRISGLLGSLLASAPAWRHIDPLPVVGSDDEENEAEWLEPDDRDADANELAVSLVLEGSHRAAQ